MVAIFTGAGTGFERGSWSLLGSQGLWGASAQGRSGDGVFVNAANGNLLISRQDEFLAGVGPDVAIARTYNSLANTSTQTADDNSDQWRQSTDRRLIVTGTANAAGSSVRRVSGDGTEIVYAWNGSLYATTEGAGAHDSIAFAAGVWTWTDGATQLKETYEAATTIANGWRLKTVRDPDSNTITLSYISTDRLKTIATATTGGVSELIEYEWGAGDLENRVTKVTVKYDHDFSVATALIARSRTTYAYDASNRLEWVTVDETPEIAGDSATAETIHKTKYEYDGSSKRVSRIWHTDGGGTTTIAEFQITYWPSGDPFAGWVKDLIQTAASGETRTTSISYTNESATLRRTSVTDPRGQVWKFWSKIAADSANGQLTRILAPPANSSAAPQEVNFTYDTSGNVSTVVQGVVGVGPAITYLYDANGNITQITDPNNNVTTRAYNATNALIRETRTGSSAAGAADPLYAHYAYGGVNKLRYAISAEGRVTEYRYNSNGLVERILEYPQHAYPIGASTPSDNALDTWRNALTDRSTVKVTKFLYDARGNLTQKITDGAANTAGVENNSEGERQDRFTYDQHGRLLSRYTLTQQTETFLYDGLDRLIGSTDLDGGATTIAFADAATTTTVTIASGFTTLSAYNKAGDLLTRVDSGADTYTANTTTPNAPTIQHQYDKNGRVRITTLAAHKDGALRYDKTYFLYDKAGKKIGEIGAGGQLTRYQYDEATGRLIATTRHQTVLTAAQLAKLADPNSELQFIAANSASEGANELKLPPAHIYDIWQWTTYDAAGRVTATILGDGSVTTHTYDQSDRLVATNGYYNKLAVSGFMTAPPMTLSTLPTADIARDRITRTFYDGDGRVIGALDSEGYLREIVYDKAGQKVQEIVYAAATTPASRATGTFTTLKGIANPANDITTRYVYDGQGLLRYSIDALNRVTETVYWEGAGSESYATGLVRRTIAYATPLGTVADYKYATIKSAMAPLAQNANLLEDSSGELLGAGSLPITSGYWAKDASGTTVIVRAPTGQQPHFDIGLGAAAAKFYSSARAVSEGQTYTVSGQNTGTGTNGAIPLRVRLEYFNASGTSIGFSAGANLNRTGTWSSLTHTAIAPTGAASARVVFDWQGGTGPALVRDVKLEVGSNATRTYNSNLLRDGSGELNGAGSAFAGGYWATDNSAAVTVTAPSGQQSYFDVTLGAAAGNFYNAAAVPATVGQTFTVTGQSNGSGTNGTVPLRARLYYYNSSGVFLSASASVNLTRNGAWTGFKLTAAAPANTASVRVVFDWQGGSGPASIRDVKLETGAVETRWSLPAAALSDRAAYNVYNDRAQLAYAVDAAGAVTAFEYDNLGRVTKTTQFASAAIMSAMGTQNAQWKAKLDAWAGVSANSTGARITRNFYGARGGDLLYTIDAEGYVTGFVYDAQGRVYSKVRYSTPLTGDWTVATIAAANKGTPISTLFRYDTLGRLQEVVDGNGARRNTLYYGTGEKMWEIEACGGMDESRTLYVYDQAGHVAQKRRYTSEVGNTGYVGTTATVIYGVQRIASPNGQYAALLTREGELRIYQKGEQIWTNGVRDTTANATFRLEARTDGKLIIFRTVAGVDTNIWERSGSNLGSASLAMQNDGVLVCGTSQGTNWSSNTLNWTAQNPTAAEFYSTSYTYDGLGNRLTMTNENGDVTAYTYDKVGRLLTQTNPLSGVTTYEYDGFGRGVRIRDPLGRDSFNFYDKLGRVIQSVDAQGHVTETVYTAFGEIGSTTRRANIASNLISVSVTTPATYIADLARDRVTSFTYDRLGRMTAKSELLDAGARISLTTAYAYDVFNSLVKTIDASGGANWLYYDKIGRNTLSVDVENYVTQSTYDSFGNLTEQKRLYNRLAAAPTSTTAPPALPASHALDRRTQYAYDLVGRVLTKLEYLDNVATAQSQFLYDRRGNVVKTIDALGGTSYFYYDKFDRVVLAIDAEGYATATTYRPSGEIASRIRYANKATGVGDPGQLPTLTPDAAKDQAAFCFYDKLGRKITEIDAELYRTDWTYDAVGNVLSERHYAQRVAAASSAPNANIMRGGDLTQGAGVLAPNWVTAGNTYTLALETVDSSAALTLRRTGGQIFTGAWTQPTWVWGGDALTKGGEYADGRFAVAAGETFGYAAEIKQLAAGPLKVWANIYFLDAAGQLVGNGGWQLLEGDAWERISASAVVPVGAVSADIRFGSIRTDSNTNAAMDFAIRKIQVHKLASSTDTVPAWIAPIASSDDRVTTFSYDKLGRLVTETDALGNATQYLYDAVGNVTQKNEAGLRTTTYQYDKLGRLTRTLHDALYEVSSATVGVPTSTSTPTEDFVYDAVGNVIQKTDAAGAKTLYWYDKLGRLTHEVSPSATLSVHSYDSNGNRTQTIVYADALSPPPANATGSPPTPPTGAKRTTQFEYDKLGRLTKTRTLNATVAKYDANLPVPAFTINTLTVEAQTQYDALGNVVLVTDAKGAKTYSYYDKLGRQIVQIDAANYRTDWSYDASGNALSERRYAIATATPTGTASPPTVTTNADDRITNFTYDKLGRRLTETRKDVKVFNTTTLDHSSQDAVIAYEYNALGAVTRKIEASSDAISYAYDRAGRMKSETRGRMVNGIFSAAYTDQDNVAVNPRVEYDYNALGDLTQTRAVGNASTPNRITDYTYNAGGRLATMKQWILGTSQAVTHTYRYDKAGRVTRDEYNRTDLVNQTATEALGYDYDSEGRVIRQGVMKKVGATWSRDGADFDTVAIKYNAFGEVSLRGFAHFTAGDPTLSERYVEQFDYDDAGRLWRTTSGDGTWKYFAYDEAGNQTLSIQSVGADIANKTLTGAGGTLDYWAANANLWTAPPTAENTVVATITRYDARNQALEVREPHRELQRVGTVGTFADLTTTRGYTAFGEVAFEINANNARIDYSYNSMGRLIRTESPAVSITSDTGVVTNNVRPVEHRYYDAAGRLVASRDANGSLTKLTLLAGTGYGGSQALVAATTTQDNAIVTTLYDALGQARKVTDQLGRVTLNAYDLMGRLTQVTHPTTTAGTLVDNYEYDGMGQRTKHWNSFLTAANAETMEYDAQGRLTKLITFGGDVTTYAYAWDGNLTTNGMTTTGGWSNFGGWSKTTTFANSKTLTEKTDSFGRDVGKTDMGGNVTGFTYDKAGRLTQRTGGLTLSQTYFNTGKLAGTQFTVYTLVVGDEDSQTDSDTRTTVFGYDKLGAVTSEKLTHAGDTWTWIPPYQPAGDPHPEPGYWEYQTFSHAYKNATAQYDALGRIVSWNEVGSPDMPAAHHDFQYDAAGNIRRSLGTYRALDAQGNFSAASPVEQDYWYKYDGLNRMTIAKGSLSAGQIVHGSTGVDIYYRADGSRFYTINGFNRREDYTYDSAGRVIEIRNGTNLNAPGALLGTFGYDLMGRLTSQVDINGWNGLVGHTRTATYNAKGQLVSDDVSVWRNDDVYRTLSTYSYGTGANYALGQVTQIDALNWKDGNTWPTKQTINTYAWRDGPVLDLTVFNGAWSTDYQHDIVGGQAQLARAVISDGRPRTVSFVNDFLGQGIKRDEADTLGGGDPHEIWYRFSGRQQAYVGNNGTIDIDYMNSVTQKQQGGPNAESYADTDLAYDPINAWEQGSRGGTYTVQAGDTLSGIAAALWGDASLWYKIAEVNGLTAESALIEGMPLLIPVGVVRSSNTAETFKPYDPLEVLGSTSPTSPAPKKKGCGVFGAFIVQVLALVIAIVIDRFVPGAGSRVGQVLTQAFSDAAAQQIGVETGIQEKFSWNQVGMAAVAAVVDVSGVGDKFATRVGVPATRPFLRGFVEGAFNSAVTQGIGAATGMQEEFSWAGVAAAGVTEGFMSKYGGQGRGARRAVRNFGARVLINAAVRSLIDGTDFSDNIIAALPSAFVNTLGDSIREGRDPIAGDDGEDALEGGPGSDVIAQQSDAQNTNMYGVTTGFEDRVQPGEPLRDYTSDAVEAIAEDVIVVTAPRTDRSLDWYVPEPSSWMQSIDAYRRDYAAAAAQQSMFRPDQLRMDSPYPPAQLSAGPTPFELAEQQRRIDGAHRAAAMAQLPIGSALWLAGGGDDRGLVAGAAWEAFAGGLYGSPALAPRPTTYAAPRGVRALEQNPLPLLSRLRIPATSAMARQPGNLNALGEAYYIRIDPAYPGRPDPQFSIDTNTFVNPVGRNAARFPRDRAQFWNAWIHKNPQSLSTANLNRIQNLGISPTIDATWLSYFPEHRAYSGDLLVHHHVNGGQYAIPVPYSTHKGSEAIWHGN